MAYPRECGGTGSNDSFALPSPGLSPRMRGNPNKPKVEKSKTGPIPANAGEPVGLPASMLRSGAYPRECGGTVAVLALPMIGSGLSPRMRGNQAGRHG